jgi:creatinine amidohydrolase
MDPFQLSHHDAGRLFARGATVFVPVNPVEYHGPHLSLRNDALVSAGLARDLFTAVFGGSTGEPLLVATDLEVGVDPCPGPGTRTTPFETVVGIVAEAARALAELGATRIVFMTFHGSPLHALALDEAIAACARRGVRAVAPLHEVLRQLVQRDDFTDLSGAAAGIADEAVRREVIATLPRDFHAGFFETSLALHYAPDSVDPSYTSLPPCPPFQAAGSPRRVAAALRALGRDALAREVEFAALGSAWYALRPFPGYTGRPSLATPGAGRFFAEALIRIMAPVVRRVLVGGEPAPRAVLGWVRPLTLRGRLPTARVPVTDVWRAPVR